MKLKNPLKPPKQKKKGKPYNPETMGVSVSCLNMFLACREQCRLRYVLGYKPLLQKSVFLEGGIYHDGIKDITRYYRDKKKANEGGAIKVALKFLKETEKEWSSGKSKTADREVALSTVDKGTAILPGYIHRWYKDDIKREWELVEDKFEVPLQMSDGKTIKFIGYYDATFKDKKKKWIKESKFKARISDGYEDSLINDLQVQGYVASLKMGGDAPAGCLFDITRKPAIRNRQGESKKDYIDRLMDDVEKRRDHYFNRYRITYTKTEINDAVMRLEFLVQTFWDWWKQCHKERDLLFNSGHCESVYGLCTFNPICANGDFSGHYTRKG